MSSSNPPHSDPTHPGVDMTTTGSFALDEVLAMSRAGRPLVSIVLPAYNEAAILSCTTTSRHCWAITCTLG